MSIQELDDRGLAQSDPETETQAGEPDLDEALSTFLTERTRLYRIARRVTGNCAEAEDVVQEVWVRWQRTDRRVISNPPAFLTTATTHLAINVIQSARVRHGRGSSAQFTDLPDPAADPTTATEREEAVGQSVALLTPLNPAERAAYILRKGFDYPYWRIAELLSITSTNARQIVCRAQVRIDRQCGPRRTGTNVSRRLVDAFVRAANGDMRDLERVLVEDVSGAQHAKTHVPAQRRAAST